MYVSTCLSESGNSQLSLKAIIFEIPFLTRAKVASSTLIFVKVITWTNFSA